MPILNGVEFPFGLVTVLLGWLIYLLCAVFEGLVHWQPGHELGDGRVECPLKARPAGT